jgi:hypothetical protein
MVCSLNPPGSGGDNEEQEQGGPRKGPVVPFQGRMKHHGRRTGKGQWKQAAADSARRGWKRFCGRTDNAESKGEEDPDQW